MAVLLKDIANKAGCSVALISSVLNNSDGNIRCSPEVAENIAAAARELGYVAKKKKPRRRLNEIAVVFPFYGADFYLNNSELIKEFESQIMRYGYKTQYFFANEIGCEAQLDAEVNAGDISGIIVVATAAAFGDEYKEAGMPVIHINPCNLRNENCIFPDDAYGTMQAAKLVDSCAFKKVLYIDRQCDHYSGELRKKVFLEQCRKDEIEVDIISHEQILPSGRFKELMNAGVDCIVAYSSDLAINAIISAKELGRKIPDDLGVIALSGDHQNYDLCPITFVKLPFYEIGRLSADCMMNMITHKLVSFPNKKINEYLVLGESCKAISTTG